MATAREQQYWLPGFGLSRHIVLGHIQYFLGPSASARPFTYQVTNKNTLPDPWKWTIYLTHTWRDERGTWLMECLWPAWVNIQLPVWNIDCWWGLYLQEQINDLAVMSREYERQEAARMITHANLDGSSAGQSPEPYINEPIPVHQRPRRQPHRFDTRRARWTCKQKDKETYNYHQKILIIWLLPITNPFVWYEYQGTAFCLCILAGITGPLYHQHDYQPINQKLYNYHPCS